MERILSIVAQPSKDFKGPRSDIAIDEVVKKLKNPRFADSVKAIAAILDEDKNAATGPSEVIQIIGHGAAGLLSLGYHWDRIYARTLQGPVFMLDSSPYTYGLLSGLVAPTTTVVIVGCLVGAADAAPAAGFADGPTLLIDLARMLKCEVAGAEEFVTAEQFDPDTGKFIGSLITSSGRRIPGKPFIAPAEPTPDRVEFRKLHGAPVLGQRYSKVDLEVQDGTSSQLRDAYTMWVEMPAEPLAMAELEFDVELLRAGHPGERCPGSLAGNLRYLRVNAADRVRWYGFETPGLLREVVDALIYQARDKAEQDALGAEVKSAGKA